MCDLAQHASGLKRAQLTKKKPPGDEPGGFKLTPTSNDQKLYVARA